MNKRIEILSDIKNVLGEGPFYKDGIISFVDIKKNTLYLLTDELKKVSFNEMVSAAIPFNDSSYLVFGERNIYLYKDNKIEIYMNINDIIKIGMRPNDAKMDESGRIWFSTIMDDGSKPEGCLYSIYDKKINFIQDTKLGNGIAFSLDNKKFYFADSAKHKVFVYDFDIKNGIISNPKTLFEVTDGVPDGMTIDKDGNLYVAIWGGSRVEVRSSSGILLDTIEVPTKLVTSCYFINDKELIITTASINENDYYAGMVFKCILE